MNHEPGMSCRTPKTQTLQRFKTLGNSNGIAELNTQRLASGVHVAVLYFDGLRVGSTKVNVVR